MRLRVWNQFMKLFSAEYLHHLTTLCQLDMRCCDWLNGDDAANHSEVKQELPCKS